MKFLSKYCNLSYKLSFEWGIIQGPIYTTLNLDEVKHLLETMRKKKEIVK